MPVHAQSTQRIDGSRRNAAALQYWSVITAYGLAAAEDIKLTSLHLDMLEWLRQDFFHHGPCPLIRLIFRVETAFADQGGVLLLLSLFPKGPVQALKIAGLPIQRKAANIPVSLH